MSSFEMSGVNPWSNDSKKFEEHLASLSENKIHKAFLRNNNNNNDID